MANPVKSDWQKLVWLARYLKGAPRLVWEYHWQADREDFPDSIGAVAGIPPSGYSDSDWAGDRKTGKSTSGGVIMRGQHLIKAWGRTQDAITLS